MAYNTWRLHLLRDVYKRQGFILALITLLQFTCGNFTPDGSVNSWVDRHWLAGRLHGGVFDPEGPLLSLIHI